ncbi:MAG: YdcF family protein [Candidatus Riflebacteria bacterium]|nr:YdcF family protein [Candidatus Riflebacteria bacterium]
MIRRLLFVVMIFAVIVVFPQIFRSPDSVWYDLICVAALLIFAVPGTWPRRDEGIGRWAVQGIAVLGCLLLLLDLKPVGSWIGRPLMLPHSRENADAIIVLASGVSMGGAPGFAGYQRFFHGYTLLKEGRAPRLYCSTGNSRTTDGFTEKQWVASFATLLSLTGPTFEIITDMVDTRGEAATFAHLLIPRGISRILLVTNGGHILRATRVFEKNGFVVLPAPVQTSDTLEAANEGNLYQFIAMVHEWLGLVQYWARGDIRFPFGEKP